MTECNYFDDLTSYTHQIAPFVMGGVKNVGWLDLTGKFPMGDVPASVLHKLKVVAGSDGLFQPLLEPIREPPKCKKCGALKLADENGKFLPSAELWIPSGEFIYASPIEILHFIEIHNYLPPVEYISAINKLDLNISFVAEEVYRKKLIKSGWFDRIR